MAWKSGQDLLKVSLDSEGKPEWDTYRIRSIRKGKVYATLIAPWTWGKKSSKHGDYGWKDPISDDWREVWRVDDQPRNVHTTKIKALEHALDLEKKYGEDDDYDGAFTTADAVKKLETMLKNERTKGKKKREAKAAQKRQAQGVGSD